MIMLGRKHTKETRKKMSENNARIWLGKKRSEESRQKMSKSAKGRKLSEEHKRKIGKALKGKSSGMLGKKHSEETKDRMSKSHKEINTWTKDEKNPNWKDGRSKEKGYRNWLTHQTEKRRKQAIGSHTFQEWENLKRKYNYMCLCCKKFEPEIKLSEDHIVPISKGGSNFIENIQPLCVSCNSRKHIKIIDYEKTDNEILVNTILDTKAEERKALIKELGKEIEKVAFISGNPKSLCFEGFEIGYNDALSDIKEILKRYND